MALGLLFNNAKYSFMIAYTEEESIASKGCLFSFSLFAVIQLYWFFSQQSANATQNAWQCRSWK